MYKPNPVNTEHITLPEQLLELIVALGYTVQKEKR